MRAQAAIRSLAECRDAQRRAEGRPCVHARFDAWLDRGEARVKAPQPTLEQLTHAVCALRQELTQGVTEGVVEHAPRAVLDQRTAVGPQCGQTRSARGPQDRTVETLVGAIRLRRPYVDGARCQRGSAPLETVLGWTARRTQPDGQQAAVQLTKEIPDETAGEWCEELTGRSLSAHTAHALTQAVATGLTVLAVAPSREASAAQIAAVATGQPWRPILGLALDGADGPTRPDTAKGRRPGRQTSRAKRARWTGAWREATGGRLYLLAADRIVPVLSWPQGHTDAAAAAARR
jgi:hypothetical protein